MSDTRHRCAMRSASASMRGFRQALSPAMREVRPAPRQSASARPACGLCRMEARAMTCAEERKPLTVEELVADCLDVRELKRKGLLKERTVTFQPLLRWPEVATMRADMCLK
jgi:hypothetical protein